MFFLISFNNKAFRYFAFVLVKMPISQLVEKTYICKCKGVQGLFKRGGCSTFVSETINKWIPLWKPQKNTRQLKR